MAIGDWDEIRTAFHVARLGTVSGAAEALGVHHATVIRHIDALEARLGAKLFQRHARGYTATEAGADLLSVAEITDDQFTQLVNRIRGRGDEVAGELVVTTLAALSARLTPVVSSFREAHPKVTVRFVTGSEVLRLEYGEAHVAVRAGRKPDNPDNVVQPFPAMNVALHASDAYIQRKGRPQSEADFPGHDFVSFTDNTRAPFSRWLAERVPPEQFVFTSNDDRVISDAIVSGAGIGFLPVWKGDGMDGVVQLFEPVPECQAPLWIVTHVDLHRTTKVQAFLGHLKAAAATW